MKKSQMIIRPLYTEKIARLGEAENKYAFEVASWANKIKIKDQLYRVNKIEYNTDKNSLAKVELLRI